MTKNFSVLNTEEWELFPRLLQPDDKYLATVLTINISDQGWKKPGNLGTCSHAHVSLACSFGIFHVFLSSMDFHKSIAYFVEYSCLHAITLNC